MRFSFFSNFIPIQKLNTSKSSKVSKDCCNSDNQIIINLTNRVDAGNVFLHHHKSRLASAAQIESAGGCRRDRWRRCGLLMRENTPTPALSTGLTPGIVNSFVSMCRLVRLASNKGCAKVTEDFAIMKKAPTRAFFWLKALVGAFSDCEIFATLCLT